MENSLKRPKIVVLDGYTLNPGDLSWNKLKALGQTSIYEFSTEDEGLQRAKEADIILVNKFQVNKSLLDQWPKLKCICVLATGFNNIDIVTAKEKGVKVCNAVGYGSASVAQHVFALLLELSNQVGLHNKSVQEGKWSSNRDFSYWLQSIPELSGKTFGIYGLGKIGRQVARIAQAFDMKILATHKHPKRDAMDGVEFVPIDILFEKSDVISLHAPLSQQNEGIVNKLLLDKMKKTAILINTGRGGLINELDLRAALLEKNILGAALDVLSTEPPPLDHPLMGLDNCLITPHIAWAGLEARERLLDITIENITSFLKGTPQNVVV